MFAIPEQFLWAQSTRYLFFNASRSLNPGAKRHAWSSFLFLIAPVSEGLRHLHLHFHQLHHPWIRVMRKLCWNGLWCYATLQKLKMHLRPREVPECFITWLWTVIQSNVRYSTWLKNNIFLSINTIIQFNQYSKTSLLHSLIIFQAKDIIFCFSLHIN